METQTAFAIDRLRDVPAARQPLLTLMLDPLLVPFVAAGDDLDAQRRLESLLEREALPLARAIATRKLRAYGHPAGRWTDDVDDVVGDAMVTMVDRLLELRRSPEAAPIESLADYTAAVTHNAVAHLRRRRHPERARFKNRVRYLLTHRERLALWDHADDGALCGLASARDQPVSAKAMESLRKREGKPMGAADTPEGLARLLEDVLRQLDGPISFDALVGELVRLLRIDEPRLVAEPADLAAPLPDAEDAIDRRRALEEAWREITALPERQRAALLLNLREARGGSLLWMLPLIGVASARRIAQALGWTDAELQRVWPGLPLDDNAIAERLLCTRQQVINLRMAARKRLTNRHQARLAGPRAGRASLTGVSRSLASDT